MKSKPRAYGKVRIIGGVWRGRRLVVDAQPGLRPTPDRIRETLFNWLTTIVPGARCLDLFSGTGALGFEALSRGASHVVMVERSKQLVDRLQESKSILDAERAEIIHADAITWLGKTHTPYDLVFLDPPFHREYVQKTCALLTNKGNLAPAGHVCAETELHAPVRVAGLKMIKQARAGQVESRLYEYNVGDTQ